MNVLEIKRGLAAIKLFQAVELGDDIVNAEGVSAASEQLEEVQAPGGCGAGVSGGGIEPLEGHEEPPGVSGRDGIGVEHGALGEDDGIGVDEVEVVGEVCVGNGKLAAELVCGERGEEGGDGGGGGWGRGVRIREGDDIPLDYVYLDAATAVGGSGGVVGKREDEHGVREGIGAHALEGPYGYAGAKRVGVRGEPGAPACLDCGGGGESAEVFDIDER